VTKPSHKAQRAEMKIPTNVVETLIERVSTFPSSVKTDYLRNEILTKYVSDDTDPAITRRTRAINKWLATERDNEATNERLLLTHEEYNILPRVTFGNFVSWCKSHIASLIGETVPVDALIGIFSGGASTSRNRTSSFPAGKYLGKAHITRAALDWFLLLGEELPLWFRAESELNLEIVSGNVMFTVPKKADIDRCACKEPDINMFMQKGVGDYLRHSLMKSGINLNDQSKNRKLARVGSIDGSLATLDLSSASDSVSRELVSLFLPVAWFSALNSLRCEVTVIDGEEHCNEMFSSMGNGFTFELETLLFLTLARAVAHFRGVSGIISVYGDDIICPSRLAPDLVTVLSYFGFEANAKKSFWEGPFRESCGGHYSDGIDITPFYIKGPPRSMPDIIHLANQLRKWAEIDGLSILDPTVEDTWLWLKSLVPSYLWGGVDTSFKYQLVSLDISSHRIQKETKSVDTGAGGYLHWHNAVRKRTEASDGVQTSTRSLDIEKYRVRPVRDRAVPPLLALFLTELG
jgi:hypothetical protein